MYSPPKDLFGRQRLDFPKWDHYRKYSGYSARQGFKQLLSGVGATAAMAYLRNGKRTRSFGLSRRRVRRRMAPPTGRRVTVPHMRPTSGVGVTTQYDKKNVYRKRYMPRYKKRLWKRFKNKVNAIAEKDLGSRTVVFNQLATFSNETNGNQVVGSVCLYPQASTTSYLNDLVQISGLENSGNPTEAAGINVEESAKIIFKSGILDVTFRNASYYKSGTAPFTISYGAEGKLEVDVYEVLMNIESSETSLTCQNFETVLSSNSSRTRTIGGAGTALAYNNRGITPFDTTYSQSRWKYKIIKKTKYLLNNLETFTYQVRDPKRRISTIRQLSNEEGFNRPGWTRIIYFTAKAVAGVDVGNDSGTWTEWLDVGITRKYLYKVEGANEDRTRYIT